MDCVDKSSHTQPKNEIQHTNNQDRTNKKDIGQEVLMPNEIRKDNYEIENMEENQGPTIDGDLDPRIQIELEKLNSSTDVINKLELDLEEARSTFRHLLGESGRQLNQMYKEHGSSVEKARCYYDARMKARAALSEAQRAAARFEKASSAHDAAKEMVTLAEEGFMERGVVHFDQAWQEMLNHATKRVNDSEVERNLSAEEHRVKSKAYQNAEQKVIVLQRSLKRSINKSRPYFEAKARLNQSLDDQKRQIQLIEETIQMTKEGYSGSLKQLEKISEEIHERRRKESSKLSESSNNIDCESNVALGTRQDGVGAEFPSPYLADKNSKKISQKVKEKKEKKIDEVKNINIEELSVCDNSTESHLESRTPNSNSDLNEPGSPMITTGCDDIDSMPLIGNLIVSKNYKHTKNRKHRKKKHKKLQLESLPNVSLESKLNSIRGSKDNENKSIAKRISVSSSSTTESAGNDATSAPNSMNSNCSRTSSRESLSSSSRVSSSSESPSPVQSPKQLYKRMTSLDSADSKSLVLNKECLSSNISGLSSKSNLGRPIHPFENNIGYDSTNILSSPMSSPMKKTLNSPTKLTNKYLSIKQEESEMSDAESLASLDPLDDSQIDQLMKEDSLKRTADDIFRLAKDQAASTPVGDSKEKA